LFIFINKLQVAFYVCWWWFGSVVAHWSRSRKLLYFGPG